MKTAKPYPYLYPDKDRQGRLRWRVRAPGRKTATIKGAFGSPEFAENYRAAMDDVEPVERKGLGIPKNGTVAALRPLFYSHVLFTSKKPGTQRSLRSYIDRFAVDHGDKLIAALQHQHVQAMVYAKYGQPSAARNFLIALRLLMRVAVAIGWRKRGDDPTSGVELPEIKGKGYRPWADEHCAQYEAAHPLGTRKRLLYAFYAWTALRGGDVARVGRQHMRPRKEIIVIGLYSITHDLLLPMMEKTGEPIRLPVLPPLQAAIEAMGQADNLPFFPGPDGGPLTPKRLRDVLREAVQEAGLEPEVCDDSGKPKGLSGHGLRKHMARKLADEIGCSEHEIAAVLGHRDLRQVRTYTQGANKDQMAERALVKLLTKMVDGEQARTAVLPTPRLALPTPPQVVVNKGK